MNFDNRYCIIKKLLLQLTKFCTVPSKYTTIWDFHQLALMLKMNKMCDFLCWSYYNCIYCVKHAMTMEYCWDSECILLRIKCGSEILSLKLWQLYMRCVYSNIKILSSFTVPNLWIIQSTLIVWSIKMKCKKYVGDFCFRYEKFKICSSTTFSKSNNHAKIRTKKIRKLIKLIS